MVDATSPAGDVAGKREMYVAFTRAKSNLHIHYNGHYLRGLEDLDHCVYLQDDNVHEKPKQVSILLSHKSVRLSYFSFVQYRVKALASGDQLTFCAGGLANAGGGTVLKYSQQFKVQLLQYEQLGYQPSQARVNFKVYWGPQDGGEEVLIILPELVLVKG